MFAVGDDLGDGDLEPFREVGQGDPARGRHRKVPNAVTGSGAARPLRAPHAPLRPSRRVGHPHTLPRPEPTAWRAMRDSVQTATDAMRFRPNGAPSPYGQRLAAVGVALLLLLGATGLYLLVDLALRVVR